MRWCLLLLALAAGCGSHCAEIAARKQALLARTAVAPGAHVEVAVPLPRANAFIAQLLVQPLVVPIEAPHLGFELPALTATAREVVIRPAGPDRLRFAIRLAIADDHAEITTLALETEVTPQLVRESGASALVAGFGPANLLAVQPELGPDAKSTITEALVRWLPRVPRIALAAAADRFGDYLIGAAYRALQQTLLHRLGELTQLRIQLPELPIASTALRSTPERVVIDVTTELPVRRALVDRPPGSEVSVRVSSSTATALANWSIDHDRLPRHYTRGLEPKPDGEYRPYFDYVAEDARRPVKLYLFQERGGCAYFAIDFLLAIDIADDKLVVSALDRYVEAADAGVVVDTALWVKQLLFGAVDSTKRAVAQTRLTIGSRSFTTRVVRASAEHDELAFELRFDAP